jgi:transposase
MSPKTPSETDSYDLNTEIALFRYGLIAPVVHDPPPGGQQEQRLREIAAKAYRVPGSTRTHVSVTTLRRYLQAYREGGFDALRPKPRADKGAPRAFPQEVLDRAIALREEQPARTTQTLVDILARDESLNLDQPINVHTLTTHLRRWGKTRRLLRQNVKVHRRFEREHVNDLWQGDAMFGPWLPDPDQPGKKRRAHLFCFIDDADEYIRQSPGAFRPVLLRRSPTAHGARAQGGHLAPWAAQGDLRRQRTGLFLHPVRRRLRHARHPAHPRRAVLTAGQRQAGALLRNLARPVPA